MYLFRYRRKVAPPHPRPTLARNPHFSFLSYARPLQGDVIEIVAENEFWHDINGDREGAEEKGEGGLHVEIKVEHGKGARLVGLPNARRTGERKREPTKIIFTSHTRLSLVVRVVRRSLGAGHGHCLGNHIRLLSTTWSGGGLGRGNSGGRCNVAAGGRYGGDKLHAARGDQGLLVGCVHSRPGWG